jgi:hypothetical protein
VSVGADYLRLTERIAPALAPLAMEGLYLPPLRDDGECRDEFGFVFLADGSVGPFYVSLPTVLATLWRRYPRPGGLRLDPVETARRIAGADLAERALALGAFNALSRALMRRAGYAPPDRGASKELTGDAPRGPVGMVGYFAPVVDRLVAGGAEVLILEQQPARVPPRPAVRVTTRPTDLAACRRVLCTASVLINDTLDELLAACAGADAFELVGPSGSGLPDPLFRRGVSAVGGVAFESAGLLRDTLARGEPWGVAGRKYRIAAGDYPGLGRLLGAPATDGHGEAPRGG